MRRFLTAITLVALVACGGSDSATAPANSIAGVWSLTTINGAVLPYVVDQAGADKVELTADVVTFAAAGTFTHTSTARTTVSGQATTSSIADAGTYTVSGTTVTIRSNSDGSTSTGTWAVNTLTIVEEGFTFVYTR
jgi:hypothetical protein